MSTDAALRDRPACCCYHFTPSPGTSPCLTLGLWDQLATQHINEVWAPWDGQPPLSLPRRGGSCLSLPPALVQVLLPGCITSRHHGQSTRGNPPWHHVRTLLPHQPVSVVGYLLLVYTTMEAHFVPVLLQASLTGHQRELPDTLVVMSQLFQTAATPSQSSAATVHVSRSYPTSAGSQLLMLQLRNEHWTYLFSQGLASHYFDRSFLDDSRVLCVRQPLPVEHNPKASTAPVTFTAVILPPFS